MYNPQVPERDTGNSFTNRVEVLKQYFTSKSNLTGIVAANSPQRNCSVYNETHYGNFEIGSTLANHLRVFDETFEFLANLEATDDSPFISDGEIIPEFDINIDFWSYIYTGGSNGKTFFNSLNMNFQDCVKIEKGTETRVIATYGLSYVSLALLLA